MREKHPQMLHKDYLNFCSTNQQFSSKNKYISPVLNTNGIADTHAARFEAGCSADVQLPVDFIDCSVFIGAELGSEYPFVILTRPACASIRYIQDQMPVIFPPALHDPWLHGNPPVRLLELEYAETAVQEEVN